MNTQEMKNNISKKFDEVSFRKFGNAFRKHIDSFFKQEYNEASLNGMNWSELASYIIADGDYNVTKENYHNFMNEF